MNCKPGDIAVVVAPGKFKGWLFEVLHDAPLTVFRLPDGYLHDPAGPCHWVVQSLSGPLRAPTSTGSRVSWYASVGDSALRPLRDPDADVSIEELKEVAA